MKCVQIPSLKEIALVKITVMLWTPNDVRPMANYGVRSMEDFRNIVVYPVKNIIREKWLQILNQLAARVPDSLPETLKYNILNLIRPVGLQLLYWMKYYKSLGLKSEPNNLCWTNRGTVDGKASVSVLIEDNSLDITERYKLACIFCFENDIRQLWNKMPTQEKKSFYCKDTPENVHQNYLVKFWTYYLEGEVAKLIETISRPLISTRPWISTIYPCVFYKAVAEGDIEAIKYFLPKLSLEEREYISIYACVPAAIGYGEVLCFLLSQINEKQQIIAYKAYSDSVLECMLEWPWQDFYLGAADMMWNFLTKDCYNFLLCSIIHKVIIGYRDYNYKKLFKIFWERSPDAHKKYVIDNCNSSTSCLSKLFEVYDKENIRLILKDATVTVREEIIFHNNGKTICKNLICHDKWDLLKFFVQECISSKGSMIKFKEEFKEHSNRSREAVKMEDKFCQLLDDLIQDDGKRNIKDGCI